MGEYLEIMMDIDHLENGAVEPWLRGRALTDMAEHGDFPKSCKR